MVIIIGAVVVLAAVACVGILVMVELFLWKLDREQVAGQALCDRLNAEHKREWLAAHPGWPDDGDESVWRFYVMK